MKHLVFLLLLCTGACCRRTWIPCNDPLQQTMQPKGDCANNWQDDAFVYIQCYGLSMNSHTQAHAKAYAQISEIIGNSLEQDLQQFGDDDATLEEKEIEVLKINKFIVCETDRTTTQQYCRQCQKETLTSVAIKYECNLRVRFSKADYRRGLDILRR